MPSFQHRQARPAWELRFTSLPLLCRQEFAEVTTNEKDRSFFFSPVTYPTASPTIQPK